MKKAIVLSLIITSASVLVADAQYKINPIGRIKIADYQQEQMQLLSTIGPKAVAELTVPEYNAIVSLAEGHSADEIEAEGYSVVDDLGDMAIVKVRIDSMETLASLPCIRSLSFGGKKQKRLAQSHRLSGTALLHSGIDLSNDGIRSFTGRGVIVGMMDTGLDPNHPNFVDASGNTRVERMWHFRSDDGTAKEYNSSTISQFTTDDEEETHATHVAGIIGGRYYGTSTYTTCDPATGASLTTTTGQNPYYGVAYGASLAFSAGELYDANILAGVKQIIDYAKAQGKPAAINLSLGMNSGPHDGTDDFSAALDRYGEDAIICVSAGNEGDMNMSIEKNFTATEKEFKTVVYYDNRYTSNIDGYIDVWASDGTPLTVTLSGVKSNGAMTQIIQSTRAGQDIPASSSHTCIRSGKINLTSGVDANNGRYNVLIDCTTLAMASGYRLALTVSGADGQSVNTYFDGYAEFTDSYSNNSTKLAGFTKGTPDGSINGMACGKNVVSVGAYTSSAYFPSLSRDAYSFGETSAEITSFSSYGKAFDGRQLPEIAAPGSAIISSFSRRYVAQGYEYETADDMVASANVNGTTEYWGPMQGTSMSAPYVTGSVALMLEAAPTLDVADVHRILAATAVTDSHTASAPERFGAGKLNVEAAVREVLRSKASISGVFDDDTQRITVSSCQGSVSVSVAGATHISLTLHDISGVEAGHTESASSEAILSTSSLQPGVYILTIKSDAGRFSRKVMVK